MKAEDNAFPSVLFAEGTTPATPAAGKQRLFFDTADGLLKSVDDTGTVTSLAYTDEQARDAIGTALTAGSNVTITVDDVANTITIASSGGGGSVADVKYTPLTGQTTVDEFSDNSLNASWVRVDNGANSSRVTWTEGGDVLSFLHNSTADAAGEEHAIMLPLASAGGSMVTGDAFIAGMQLNRPASTAGPLVFGMVLADGTTYGSGLAVGTMTNGGAGVTASADTNDFRTLDGYNSGGTATDSLTRMAGKLFHIRFVKTGATTWRRDYSEDGISWLTGGASLTKSFTPTHVGFWCSNWGSATAFHGSIEYLRRVSGVS